MALGTHRTRFTGVGNAVRVVPDSASVFFAGEPLTLEVMGEWYSQPVSMPSVLQWGLIIIVASGAWLYAPLPTIGPYLNAGAAIVLGWVVLVLYNTPGQDGLRLREANWECRACGHLMRENSEECPECEYTIFDSV